MRKTDQWTGMVLLIVAAFICLGSARLPYGNLHRPGPGFLPFWLGILLGAMSLALIVKTSFQRTGAKTIGELLTRKIRWGKVLAILVALTLYGVGVETIGFLLATFLLLAFLIRFIDPQRWRSAIGWALVGSVGSYLLFEVWLKLRLPKGFLGF